MDEERLKAYFITEKQKKKKYVNKLRSRSIGIDQILIGRDKCT